MSVLSSEEDGFEVVSGDFDAVRCCCLLRFDPIFVIFLFRFIEKDAS